MCAKRQRFIPNFSKLIPVLKTRNGSELVCEKDNITLVTLTGVFIVYTCLNTLIFYRYNYYYNTVEENSKLRGAVAKAADELTSQLVSQKRIENFRELNSGLASGSNLNSMINCF